MTARSDHPACAAIAASVSPEDHLHVVDTVVLGDHVEVVVEPSSRPDLLPVRGEVRYNELRAQGMSPDEARRLRCASSATVTEHATSDKAPSLWDGSP